MIVLHLLAVNADNVCTADQIVTHIWGFGYDGDAGLIKAHIRHLRQKIERDPSSPVYILTVSGVGYVLTRRYEVGEQHGTKDLSRTLRVASL